MDTNNPKVVGRARPRRARVSLESWPLRWKVAATLVVPVVLAATFGALRIQNELSAASKLSVAAENTRIVAPAVEFVDRLDELAAVAAVGGPITEPLARFDESAESLATLIRSADFDSTVTAELSSAAATARALRDDIAAGPVTQVQLAEQAESVATDVISAVTTSTAAVDDGDVRPLAEQLTTVLAAQRALTTQRLLVTAPDFATAVALRTQAAEAAGAEVAAAERLARLMPDGDGAVVLDESDVRRDEYTRPLGESVDPAVLGTSMTASVERYQALGQQLSTDLETTVEARANSLRSAALRDTAIILGAVLAALVFALGVGRSLIRSIGRLRRGAVEVAQVQLPEEIDQLSRGAGVPAITALPVDTDEEVGQLARAIDDIHLQAVRLASEHGVRLQIGDMFETLSRRSRSLVEEQLVLIETLEHDEDDPDRLDHLFRLDHLATRMRRNGDNLLVLADTVERHRRLEPVPVLEMLRAAMSEVEDYRRVQLGPVVDGSIVGAAAGDIGHLIAELLDNALQYSPPDTPVWVAVSRAVDAGILVEIADRGLGMPADDLLDANERLSLGGEVTSDTAKRMGLFVVGRLARRHGATVRLRTPAGVSGQPGVTASVHLPGALLVAPTEPADGPTGPPADAQLRPIRRANVSDGGQHNHRGSPAVSPKRGKIGVARTGSRLPQRSPGASGVGDVTGPLPRPTVVPPVPETVPPAPVPPAPVTPVWPQAESDDGSIYARMTSEWGSTDEPNGDADAGRHTQSGLPIRERGARLMPEQATTGSDDSVPTRNDPAAVRNVLSRQLAGVRRGRAHSEAAHRRGEGD